MIWIDVAIWAWCKPITIDQAIDELDYIVGFNFLFYFILDNNQSG